MDWIPLLASVIRLADLHDSQRVLGNPPEYAQELRSGNKDGVYLYIGIDVIQCLRTLEQSSVDDYMPLSQIVRFVRKQRPATAEIDVQFVLNVLRRPTELWYVGQDTPGEIRTLRSEKNTALLEKTAYADEYRLSRAGRATISLASAYKSVAYMESDALRILRAVEGDDFHLLATFADDLIQQLRREILDIRDVQEKIGQTGVVEQYITNFRRYQKVIDNTIAMIRKAEQTLDTSETYDRFVRWQERPDVNTDITYDQLGSYIHRVRQVLEVFNRAITQLVGISLHSKQSAVPPPSFLALAIHFVEMPPAEAKLEGLLRQWGAMGLSTPFFSALDAKGAVKLRKQGLVREAVRFHDGELEAVSRIGKIEFLDRHGAAIASALKAAPISLSEALGRGWFMLDQNLALGDLLGVFFAPDSLPIEGKLSVSLSDELRTADLECGEFLYNDLKITVQRDEEVIG
jgi:hypothetical protein